MPETISDLERIPNERREKIQELNDLLRITFIGGRIVCTAGIVALGEAALAGILKAIREFESFTPENDPYGEHDFGIVTVGEVKCYWKIDYYDSDLLYGSEDPSDPAKTTRVLTIMLPLEY